MADLLDLGADALYLNLTRLALGYVPDIPVDPEPPAETTPPFEYTIDPNGMDVEYLPAVVILTASVNTFREECAMYGIDADDPSFIVIARDGLALRDAMQLPADTPVVFVGSVFDPGHAYALRQRFGDNVRLPEAVRVLNNNKAWCKGKLWL